MWTGDVPKIAFTVFGKDVAWYGIILTCAMLIGLVAAIFRGKKLKLKADDLLEVFLFAIPCAIIIGRLGFVGAHLKDFFYSGMEFSDFWKIFAVWDGGITIITAVPGGVFGAFLWSKWRHVDLVKAMDYIIPVVLLSQGLGRWGNFMNQEIYGAAVTNPDLQFFPFAVYIKNQGGWFQACFFYEMVLDLLGFVILVLILRHLYCRWSGTLLYTGTYALIRMFMELFRNQGDTAKDIPYPLIGMALLSVAAFGLLTYLLIRAKKSGKRIWYANGVPKEVYGDVWNCYPKKKKKAADLSGEGGENLGSEENSEAKTAVKKPPENKSKKKKRR